MRRRILGFAFVTALAVVCALGLSACSGTSGGDTIQVGAVVVRDSPEVQALRQANTSYAVLLWHARDTFPKGSLRVDVSLIQGHGQKSVWSALNVGEVSIHNIPRHLITANAQFCVRIYGDVQILNDSYAEYAEGRANSCDPPGVLHQSVLAGRSTETSGWRRGIIIR